MLIVFLFVGAAVLVPRYFDYRLKKQRLEAIHDLVRKGQTIPPEFRKTLNEEDDIEESVAPIIASRNPVSVTKKRGLKRGVFWVATGLGVMIALGVTQPESKNWVWGVVPLLIGLSSLLVHYLETEPNSGIDTSAPRDQ